MAGKTAWPLVLGKVLNIVYENHYHLHSHMHSMHRRQSGITFLSAPCTRLGRVGRAGVGLLWRCKKRRFLQKLEPNVLYVQLIQCFLAIHLIAIEASGMPCALPRGDTGAGVGAPRGVDSVLGKIEPQFLVKSA